MRAIIAIIGIVGITACNPDGTCIEPEPKVPDKAKDSKELHVYYKK